VTRLWPVGQRGPKTYRILTRLEGSVGPDSIRLVEDSIVDPVTYRSNFANQYGGGGGGGKPPNPPPFFTPYEKGGAKLKRF